MERVFVIACDKREAFAQGSEATKQSSLPRKGSWIASRSLSSGAHSRDPLARNDGECFRHAFEIPRRDAPEFCVWFRPRNQRAQGKPGARCTRGPVCKLHEKCAHEHTGPAESIRLSLRNGFTAYT